MSDIYLQITETPAVVTLSAPVVSGALASTVTVANTVTVALDSNSLSALENVTVTVGAAITGTVTVSNFPASQAVTFSAVSISNLPATQAVSLASVPTHGVTLASTTVTVNSLPSNLYTTIKDGLVNYAQNEIPFPIGVNGTVELAAGTAEIGSVFVSNISSLPDAGENSVIRTFMFGYDYAGDVPVAIAANGTAISVAGSVTASISNSVVTFYPAQGTTVTNSNFTSTTASTTLVSAVAGREVLTVFNEGAGNLYISPGATCTTIAYQVRLSAGDYWECPAGQLSLAHTAVFATAGTARVTQVS
jgi:hypothetical protein